MLTQPLYNLTFMASVFQLLGVKGTSLHAAKRRSDTEMEMGKMGYVYHQPDNI